MLFIGGSNLVINNGIKVQLVRALSDLGILFDNVENIAVGGTGSLFGLENLQIEGTKFKDFRVIIVEYGINDWGNFSSEPLIWQLGYQLLLKEIRVRWPEAIVFNIIFGRRDEPLWARQKKLHTEMINIGNVLGAINIDIDSHLKGFADTSYPFQMNYRDDAHFVSPRVTHHVSLIVAIEIFRVLSSSNPREKLTDNLIHSDRKIVYKKIGENDTEFKNSQFHRLATRLKYGQSIEFTLPGLPNTLSFCSTKNSGSVLIEYNGVKKIIHTSYVEDTTKFEFLVKHCILEKTYDGKIDKNHDTVVKLTAIDSSHHDWNQNYIQKIWGVCPSISSYSDCFLLNISSIVVK